MIFLNDIERLVLAGLGSDFVKQFEPFDFVLYIVYLVFFIMVITKIVSNNYFVKKQQNWLVDKK